MFHHNQEKNSKMLDSERLLCHAVFWRHVRTAIGVAESRRWQARHVGLKQRGAKWKLKDAGGDQKDEVQQWSRGCNRFNSRD